VAYTTADLSAIRSAMAKGELEVEFVDRRVRYRSIAELKAAEAEIVKHLASPRHKQSLGYAGKGLACS
jgi:hypothetical protein